MTASDPPLDNIHSVSEFPCANCSYDLRGLPLSSNCPECGTQIHRSMQDTLEFTTDGWLHSVRIGLGIISLAVHLCSVLIILPILALVIALTVMLFTRDPSAATNALIVDIIVFVLQMSFIGGLVLGAVGVALLTRPELRDQRETVVADRRIARIGLGIAGIGAAVWVVLFHSAASTRMLVAADVVLCTTIITIGIVSKAVLSELADIARRAGKRAIVEQLQRQQKTLLKTITVFAVALTGFHAAKTLGMAHRLIALAGLAIIGYCGYSLLSAGHTTGALGGELRHSIRAELDRRRNHA